MIRRVLVFAAVILLTTGAVAEAQTYGTPGITVSGPLVPGTTVTVTACCYVPGTVVVFNAQTARVRLFPSGAASVVAGPDGVASLTTTIPADTPLGPVTLNVSGTPIPGTSTPPSQSSPEVVVEAPPTTTTTTSTTVPVPPTSAAVAGEEIEAGGEAGQTAVRGAETLPVTGSGLAPRLAAVATLLLAAGALNLLVSRRRRTH